MRLGLRLWLLLLLPPLLVPVLAPVLRAQNRQVFEVPATPLAGVTLAGASANIQQVGQSMHVIKVEFPTAVATVSAIQVRLEFSYDGVTFLPLSLDILEAPLLSGTVHAYALGYGAFRALRVNNVIPIPGAPPPAMTVRYMGHYLTTVTALGLLADRWTF